MKKTLLLGIPLLGGALVAVALLRREATERVPSISRKAPAVALGPVLLAPPPAPMPRPAPEKDVASAMEEARLKTTYQNYRTALATDNRPQADAIYPILLRERKAALRLAEQDLAQARQDFDRAVAEKALAALRR
jgi:hypothetical protein